MFTGAAVISGGGNGNSGLLEGLIIEKLNGWDIEKRYTSVTWSKQILAHSCSTCYD